MISIANATGGSTFSSVEKIDFSRSTLKKIQFSRSTQKRTAENAARKSGQLNTTINQRQDPIERKSRRGVSTNTTSSPIARVATSNGARVHQTKQAPASNCMSRQSRHAGMSIRTTAQSPTQRSLHPRLEQCLKIITRCRGMRRQWRFASRSTLYCDVDRVQASGKVSTCHRYGI